VSFEAVSWAIKDAPLSDQTAKIVLIVLAEPADSDGCGAFLSKKTISKYALVDPKTVQRKLNDLKAQGVIREGDQTRAAYIPEHRRPVVYDIQIPYSWFGTRIDRINEDRIDAGLDPLTTELRPDLAAAPERAARSDKGLARDQGAVTGRDAGGDSQSPGDSQSRKGGLSVPPGGDSQSPEPMIETNERTSPPLRGGERAHAHAHAHAHAREGADSAQGTLPVDEASVDNPDQTKILTGARPDLGKRGRRALWPGRFDPSPEQFGWAAKHYPAVDALGETLEFNAYFDAPERAGMVRDWAASWRTWMRKASERGPRGARSVLSPELVERARPTVDAWCGWWADRGPVTAQSRDDLLRRVVSALQAGATVEQVQGALRECRELVPAPWRFQNALLGVPSAGGMNGRKSTTDLRVAQVDDAVAAATADLLARAGRQPEQVAIGGDAL
jgi:hypothetical protein